MIKIKFIRNGKLIEYKRSKQAEKNRLLAVKKSGYKISRALEGRKPKNFNRALQQKAWEVNSKEILTYSGIHAWVRRNWGIAREYGKCDLCNKKENRSMKIHWANKSHKYTRNRDDWQVVCRPCHFKYDQKNHRVNFFGRHNQNTIES